LVERRVGEKAREWGGVQVGGEGRRLESRSAER